MIIFHEDLAQESYIFCQMAFPSLGNSYFVDVSPFALDGFGMGFLATGLLAQVEALLELEPNIY